MHNYNVGVGIQQAAARSVAKLEVNVAPWPQTTLGQHQSNTMCAIICDQSLAVPSLPPHCPNTFLIVWRTEHEPCLKTSAFQWISIQTESRLIVPVLESFW
jgi:hypothetical protein